MVRKWRSKMKKLITLFAVLGMVLALAPAAQAAVVANSSAQADPYATSGVFTGNDSNSVIGVGAKWTHSVDLLKFGNNNAATLTVSGGGWLEVQTGTGIGDTYALQIGNQSSGTADALVTGAGSKVTVTNGLISVARQFGPSFLTIEDGGLVMTTNTIVMGRTGGGGSGFVRMGYGGILAVAGTKTLAQMATVESGSGEFQYWTGSGWDDIVNATEGASDDYTLAAGTDDLAGYTVLTMLFPPPAGTVFIIH